jgi:hypothetical protein
VGESEGRLVGEAVGRSVGRLDSMTDPSIKPINGAAAARSPVPDLSVGIAMTGDWAMMLGTSVGMPALLLLLLSPVAVVTPAVACASIERASLLQRDELDVVASTALAASREAALQPLERHSSYSVASEVRTCG